MKPQLKKLLIGSLTAGLWIVGGCVSDKGSGRRFSVVKWDTVWRVGRPFLDSLLPSPGLLTFSGSRLFAYDNAMLWLATFDARRGAPLWKAGGFGHGPEEFAGVAAVFPDPARGVGVVDMANRRIARVDPEGRFIGLIPIATIGQQPNQICAFGRNRFVAADVFQPLLMEFDSSGTLTKRFDPIWADLVAARWESHQVILRNNESGDACLVALSTGRGFAVLSPNQEAVVSPYVEMFEVYGIGPRKDEGEVMFSATFGGGFVGDTLWIHFWGRSSDKQRLVDRYDRFTGKYLDTWRLPFKTAELVIGDGMVFLVDSSGTSILALRHRS